MSTTQKRRREFVLYDVNGNAIQTVNGGYLKTVLYDSTGDTLDFNQADTDGQATGQVKMPVRAFPMLFNGATYDRPKGVNTGQAVVTHKDSSGVEQYGNDARVETYNNSGSRYLKVQSVDNQGAVAEIGGFTTDNFNATYNKYHTIALLCAVNPSSNIDRLQADASKNLKATLLDAGANQIEIETVSTDNQAANNSNWLKVKSALLAINAAGNVDRLQVDASKHLKVNDHDSAGNEKDKRSFHANLELENVSASAQYHLVDISDTANFPHASGTKVILRSIHVMINGSTAFTGDVHIGALENVDATNGDFKHIYAWHEGQGSSNLNHVQRWPAGFDTLAGISNADSVNDVKYQTDVNLSGSPASTTVPSGNGDLVLDLEIGAGNADISITIEYDTE